VQAETRGVRTSAPDEIVAAHRLTSMRAALHATHMRRYILAGLMGLWFAACGSDHGDARDNSDAGTGGTE